MSAPLWSKCASLSQSIQGLSSDTLLSCRVSNEQAAAKKGSSKLVQNLQLASPLSHSIRYLCTRKSFAKLVANP
jgi:hypothetical protein